jgi:hypothetical protein
MVILVLVLSALFNGPARADPLTTTLHFSRTQDGFTAADDNQWNNGTGYDAMLVALGPATYLQQLKTNSVTCSTHALLQHGQWTVFAIQVDSCH